jgi:hypothetical protein
MKTAAFTGVAIAALAATAIATPSLARDPCQQHKHNSGTTGAVIGGLAGAVLGSNVAGHGAKTEGSIIGGVAGAALGNSIGRDSVDCDGYAYYQRGYYDSDGHWHAYASNRSYYSPYAGQYGYNSSYYSPYYATPYNDYYDGYAYAPY